MKKIDFKFVKEDKIYLAGHSGFVGSAIFSRLKYFGFKKILTTRRNQLDLFNQNDVYNYLKKHKPKFIIIAAARVGGILANNKYRANFIYENLAIQNNLIHGSFLNGIKNLIFLGSSCVYPKFAKQPIKEEYLLTGALEATSEPYAIAKIAGIKMCESYNRQYNTNYKCLMPTNAYGPGDHYDLANSHFFPALVKKIYQAKISKKKYITLWGSGEAYRELVYVNDLADACIFFMKKKTKEYLINIGSSKEFSIKEYANFIISELKLNLKIKFDRSIPDGTLRKLLNCSVANSYGWYPKVSLKEGFFETYKDFINKVHK